MEKTVGINWVNATESVPHPHPSKITDSDKFKNFIDKNEDKTQKQLAEMWGCFSYHTITRELKKF
jgi:predicted HTH transcriptional regulator